MLPRYVPRLKRLLIVDGRLPSSSLSRSCNTINFVKPPISGKISPVNSLLFAMKYFKFFSLYKLPGRELLKKLLSILNSSGEREMNVVEY